eukprot:2838724-Pyramimonas_sp.AAC.1
MRPCEPSAAVDASVCGSFRKRAWNAMRVVTLRAMMRPRGSGARRHPRPLLTDGGFAEPSVLVRGLGELRMQQVSAGWGHVLALSECGVLLAWGHSAHGRLGLKPPRPASGGTQKAQITHNQPT